MDTYTTAEASSSATQTPLCPFPIPGRVRYGLMSPKGEYLVVPYQLEGRWREWHLESYDAISWDDLATAKDAAKVWNELHMPEGPVIVVTL